MTTPQYHFISGLPRSGSTLLAALLLQNPRFHAGMMSPVGALLNSMLPQFSAGSEFGPLISREQRQRLVRGIFDSYYKDKYDKEVIFDTNRMWCSKLPILMDQFPGSKIIACVRNVAWIMDSLERRYRANPYEQTSLFIDDVERNTIYSRVDTLAQRNRLVGFAWAALKEAFYSEHASSMLLVDYDLLVQAPKQVLTLIYQFIGQKEFSHDVENLQFDAPEFDGTLGLHGMHKVRPKISVETRHTILPPDLFDQYSKLSFWKDTTGSQANVVTVQPLQKKDAS